MRSPSCFWLTSWSHLCEMNQELLKPKKIIAASSKKFAMLGLFEKHFHWGQWHYSSWIKNRYHDAPLHFVIQVWVFWKNSCCGISLKVLFNLIIFSFIYSFILLSLYDKWNFKFSISRRQSRNGLKNGYPMKDIDRPKLMCTLLCQQPPACE